MSTVAVTVSRLALAHLRRLFFELKEPEVVLTEGNVPERLVAEILVDPAGDFEFLLIDLVVLVSGGHEVGSGDNPGRVAVEE